MHELPILTSELVLRLERSIAPKAAIDGSPSQVVKFGSAIAKKECHMWPPSAVYCFGRDSLDRLGDILQFFGSVDPVFYLAPSGFTRQVAEALNQKGYFQSDWRQTTLYGLPDSAAPKAAGVSIERVTSNTIDMAADVAAEGNQWSASWAEAAKEAFRKQLDDASKIIYLAYLGRDPAGTADLSFDSSERLCRLGGAAVIPRFRNKGMHTQLIRTRLYEASRLGCEMVVGNADFVSASFRNQQRCGLRLAYLESTWRKHVPEQK